jgi:hypothetical protein
MCRWIHRRYRAVALRRRANFPRWYRRRSREGRHFYTGAVECRSRWRDYGDSGGPQGRQPGLRCRHLVGPRRCSDLCTTRGATIKRRQVILESRSKLALRRRARSCRNGGCWLNRRRLRSGRKRRSAFRARSSTRRRHLRRHGRSALEARWVDAFQWSLHRLRRGSIRKPVTATLDLWRNKIFWCFTRRRRVPVGSQTSASGCRCRHTASCGIESHGVDGWRLKGGLKGLPTECVTACCLNAGCHEAGRGTNRYASSWRFFWLKKRRARRERLCHRALCCGAWRACLCGHANPDKLFDARRDAAVGVAAFLRHLRALLQRREVEARRFESAQCCQGSRLGRLCWQRASRARTDFTDCGCGRCRRLEGLPRMHHRRGRDQR